MSEVVVEGRERMTEKWESRMREVEDGVEQGQA